MMVCRGRKKTEDVHAFSLRRLFISTLEYTGYPRGKISEISLRRFCSLKQLAIVLNIQLKLAENRFPVSPSVSRMLYSTFRFIFLLCERYFSSMFQEQVRTQQGYKIPALHTHQRSSMHADILLGNRQHHPEIGLLSLSMTRLVRKYARCIEEPLRDILRIEYHSFSLKSIFKGN